MRVRNALAFGVPVACALMGGPLAEAQTKAGPSSTSAASTKPAAAPASTRNGPVDDSDPTHLKRNEYAAPFEAPQKQATGPVLDLCVMGATGGGSFQRPRAVVFAPANASAADKDWPYAGTPLSDEVADVFVAMFPMDRFTNVVTRLAADGAWVDADTVGMDQMTSYATTSPLPRSFGGTGADAASRAAKEREFVKYSLGCTDYVFVARLDRLDATWIWKKPVAIEKHDIHNSKAPASLQANPKLMYLPDQTSVVLTMTIFKRDGANFKKLQTFGPVGFAQGDRSSNEGSASDIPGYISAIPRSSCAVPGGGVDGQAGLSCPDGIVDAHAVPGSFRKLDSTACSAEDYNAPDAFGRCDVRDKTAWTIGGLQQRTKKMKEFRLYSQMYPGTAGPGMPIGKYEGVKKGMDFAYYLPDGRLWAYYKVVQPGPGGPERGRQITLLNSRYGTAPDYARLEEIPLIGWAVSGFADVSHLYRGGSTSYQGRNYDLGNNLVGGGISLAIDGSPAWLEWWITLRLAGLYNGGQNSTSGLARFDIATEKGFYMGERLKLVFEIGATGLAGSTSLKEAGATGGNATSSFKAAGGMGGVALDVTLVPKLSVRTSVDARFYGKTTYTGDAAPAAWRDRSDRFSTLGTRLEVGYHF